MKKKNYLSIPTFLVYCGIIVSVIVLSCKDKPIGKIQKIIYLDTNEWEYKLIGDSKEWSADTNHHGGIRQWYGGKPEPTKCHIVLITPGAGEGGGPQKILCAGSCEEGETCNLDSISGKTEGVKTVEYFCKCKKNN